MSTDRNSPPLPSPNATDRRRASITSQTFQDLFGRQSGGQQGTQAHPGPITTAAVNAQRRRLSLTTIGLSASPNQTSPFPTTRPRTESLSSANSGSVDESPFEDDPPPSASASNPATPFARRLSFGARALRDVRQSNGSIGNSNGRPSIHKASSPPTARGRASSSSAFPHVLAEHFKQHPDHALGEHELTSLLSNTGEGYNFAENLRSRAERTSISGAHPMHSTQAQQQHQRAKSVTIMEPPAREMPKQARVPDAMQERILKGDFYMD
ncbi:hypothetical protein K505DRAFT_135157 [Melanomma pulvis-pyrius CBS 109.77]|uniref:Uncharacterized protein n=1 Tax=Melanomma pulvis-pyrius CBS 109.77 TaxID=1314802 RepID=A0A6A6XMX4_9PLEO|nr:hypothetical protein K505DRAFT_135157 [Melanomma pulvis-pyrius CBS 109.77]